ncbi:MAG: tetratricopeptide repeat protein [Nitrospirae bacterium]|nr:tetratricopeptide repeat protein [Nitrospirota bacterium]
MNIVLACLLILFSAYSTEAALLYKVPADFSVKEEVIKWPQGVQGSGSSEFKEALGSYKKGDYNLALSQFRLLAEKFPGSDAAATANMYAGSIYYKMAGFSDKKKDSRLLMDALQSFQKALRYYPGEKYAPVILLEIGKIYSDLNFLAEASGSFKRVIKEYSATEYAAEGQYLLALSYMEEGSYNEALSEYKILAIRYPGELEKERVFGTGEVFLSLHEFGEAKKFYDEGLRRWPAYVKGSPKLLFDYSECQFQNGEFIEAREGFLTFYNIYPKGKEAGAALNRVGDTYMLERRAGIAEKIYAYVLELFPKSRDAFVSMLALGDVKLSSNSGDKFYQDALKYYKDVEDLSGDEGLILKARYSRGRIFEAEGKYRKALNVYTELLGASEESLRKEVSYSLNNLIGKIGGEVEERLRRSDHLGVVRLYQTYYKNILEHVKDERLLMMVAEAHEKLLLYNDASIIYQMIIGRSGGKKEMALFESGRLYARMGDDRKAVEVIGSYLEDYPKGERVVDARVIIGEGLYNLKEYKKAANVFYSVMRDAPYRYPAIYIKLADIMQKTGQHEESVNILTDLLRHPQTKQEGDLLSQVYISLGNAYVGIRRYQDALDAYTAVVKNSKSEDETVLIQLIMGDCLIRLGRKDEAKEIFSMLKGSAKGIVKQFSEGRLKDMELKI